MLKTIKLISPNPYSHKGCLCSPKFRGVKEEKEKKQKDKKSIWRPMVTPPGTMGKNKQTKIHLKLK